MWAPLCELLIAFHAWKFPIKGARRGWVLGFVFFPSVRLVQVAAAVRRHLPEPWGGQLVSLSPSGFGSVAPGNQPQAPRFRDSPHWTVQDRSQRGGERFPSLSRLWPVHAGGQEQWWKGAADQIRRQRLAVEARDASLWPLCFSSPASLRQVSTHHRNGGLLARGQIPFRLLRCQRGLSDGVIASHEARQFRRRLARETKSPARAWAFPRPGAAKCVPFCAPFASRGSGGRGAAGGPT